MNNILREISYSLHHLFGVNLWITVFLLLLAFVTIMFMLIYCLILFLDGTYRPNTPQYPYNIVLDRIIPIIACFSPAIIVLYLDPESTTSLQKFGYIILIHCFILIPIMSYWSKHRYWNNNLTVQQYVEWNQPILYKCLTIGLVYPALWGIYFSFNRYNKLGEEISLMDLISSINIDFFIITIFLMPLLFYWIVLILWEINKYRYWFWFNYVSIINLIYIFCLRYKLCFYLFQMFHKISFIIGRYISLVDDVNPRDRKYSFFRYSLQFIFVNPWILYLGVLFFIIAEIIISAGKLKYSLYLLFWFPIIYALSYLFSVFYTREFIDDVCKADYFARNWKNPRYPKMFWVIFNDRESLYQFEWDFTQEELIEINKLINIHLKKPMPLYFQFPRKVQHKSYCLRLRAAYRSSFGVRWVHTASVERPLHSLTGYFVRNLIERVALIYDNWKPHYQIISNAERNYPSVNSLESWYQNTSNSSSQNIRQVMEHNFITNFFPLVKNGASVMEFNTNLHLDTKPKNNVELDSIINMKGSSFIDQRVHGVDQKTKQGFSSVVYSNMEDSLYKQKLRRFGNILLYNHPEISRVLVMEIMHKLGESCNDIAIHQMVWATNLHHFPSNFIPPMKINKHFSLADARPEFMAIFHKAQLKIKRISDYLYVKKIPQQNYQDPLPEAALDLFKDSELQKLLSQ